MNVTIGMRRGERIQPSIAADLLRAAISDASALNDKIASDFPIVPGYQIITRLGAGASGEVWLAEENQINRIVALKILHGSDSPGLGLPVLDREIRTLAAISHPNLVSLFNPILTSQGKQGFAMEWVDGLPLDQWLDENPFLTQSQGLKVFREIVSGVSFLHDHGVIHRDLKPANIIVASNGTPKIVDFGLARMHQLGAIADSRSESMGSSGTLHFMAPEQASNRAGARSMTVDVYALGLMLYRLLTNEWLHPAGNTPSETLAAVMNPKPFSQWRFPEKVPRDLRAILRKALDPNIQHRYHHARELAADMDRHTAGKPVFARKHTFAYLTSSLIRRQGKRSLIAASLMLVALAGSGFFYHYHRQVAERNDANLRHAYSLASFTIHQLREVLYGTSSTPSGRSSTVDEQLKQAVISQVQALPVNADGELDLRYYQAQLSDIRAASFENRSDDHSALGAIQQALNLYSRLSSEQPQDPDRLMDAARARLNFARLLDLTGRTETAGIEAGKVLQQLKRLASWQNFDASVIPPFRCEALLLVAKKAMLADHPQDAVAHAREALASAVTLSPASKLKSGNQLTPHLAKAAFDLANYSIKADPRMLPQVRLDIDGAIAASRVALEREPQAPHLAHGLAQCLHAKAQISLHMGGLEPIGPLLEEGTGLLISDDSPLRLSSFSLMKNYLVTSISWMESVLGQSDMTHAERSLDLSLRLVSHLRANGAASGDTMLLRARLFIAESQLAERKHQKEDAARAAGRALRLLCMRGFRNSESKALSLLTAQALHRARELSDSPAAKWDRAVHEPQLEGLLQDLAKCSEELTPNQQTELAKLMGRQSSTLKNP
jgi:serine/threonine protein kinase